MIKGFEVDIPEIDKRYKVITQVDETGMWIAPIIFNVIEADCWKDVYGIELSPLKGYYDVIREVTISDFEKKYYKDFIDSFVEDEWPLGSCPQTTTAFDVIEKDKLDISTFGIKASSTMNYLDNLSKKFKQFE